MSDTKPRKKSFESSIPADLDDSDWFMREGRVLTSDEAFEFVAPHAAAERRAEDARVIRTGKLMR